jgi:hypothetical protein
LGGEEGRRLLGAAEAFAVDGYWRWLLGQGGEGEGRGGKKEGENDTNRNIPS